MGRWISVDLSEKKVKSEIQRRFIADLDLVDRCGINGLCKLFLYEHFVVRRLSWVFLVHDLCLSFARDLDKEAIRRLKRLYRGVRWEPCSVHVLTLACNSLQLSIT